MNRCPNCGEVLEEAYKFCPQCGNKIEDNIPARTAEKNSIVKCDVCGEETTVASGYCLSCGAKLSGKEEIITTNYVSEPPANKFQVNKPKKLQGDTGIKDKSKAKKTTAAVKKPEPKLNTSQILLVVIMLLLAGFIILELAGVFDKAENRTEQVQTNNNPQQQSPVVDMAALEQINTLESTVKRDSSNADNILELAHKLNDAGFFERATEYYKMYLRKNPKNADVQVDLGVCYFELKQYENAKYYMNKGLTINPSHQIALFNLGIVNLSAGNADSAKYWWNKAAAVNPASEIGKKAKELLEQH